MEALGRGRVGEKLKAEAGWGNVSYRQRQGGEM